MKLSFFQAVQLLAPHGDSIRALQVKHDVPIGLCVPFSEALDFARAPGAVIADEKHVQRNWALCVETPSGLVHLETRRGHAA